METAKRSGNRRVFLPIVSALVVILAGTFWLRSVAASRLSEAEARLTADFTVGEQQTDVGSGGCRGTLAAVLPFGNSEKGEVKATRAVLDSFVLETAVARHTYTPLFEEESGETDLGLEDLAVRKELTIELRLLEGQWCVDLIQLDASVVSSAGAVDDDRLINLALQASDLSAQPGASTTDVLGSVLDCECLEADEKVVIEELLLAAAWDSSELR